MTNFPHRLCVPLSGPVFFLRRGRERRSFAYKFAAIVINSEAGISSFFFPRLLCCFLTSVIYIFKCNTMSRLCQKEMGQKHRRDSTKHMRLFFLPEGTCNKKKVGLNLIFGGTLITSSVLKRSRETNKENTTLSLPLRLSSYFRT